jgi:hypothetical protein
LKYPAGRLNTEALGKTFFSPVQTLANPRSAA